MFSSEEEGSDFDKSNFTSSDDFDSSGPDTDEYLDFGTAPKDLPEEVDLSFLGYEKKRIRPHDRRPQGKFVPPPPADLSELRRTHFRIPATKREAELQQGYFQLSDRIPQYKIARRMYKKKMTQSRKVWVAELEEAKKKRQEAYLKEREEIEKRREERESLKAQVSKQKQEASAIRLEKEMAAAKARYDIRQARKAQMDQKIMDRRRYQLYYLAQEREQWFENLDDITEELFEPQNEVSPNGWWPVAAMATPRVSMKQPAVAELISKLERKHRMKHAIIE